MIKPKTKKEIEIMQKSGKILGEVISELLKMVRPGVSEIEIDKKAEELIRKKGAQEGFKEVPGYKNTICISVNDVVVHGIPTEYRLKEEDIVGIDCGVYYKGFHTDAAETVRVSKKGKKDEVDRFLEVGKTALFAAIGKARAGNRIGHISRTIQDIVEGAHFSVVRNLVGHGVGRSLHEEPQVPGFLDVSIDRTPLLIPGMTIAIEVIYNMGGKEVLYKNNDGWTIVTADGSLSGLFERTVLVTEDKPVVLTPITGDEEYLKKI
jgi:methionyl aminopeptidase